MLNDKQIIIAREITKAERSVSEIMQEQGYARETYYSWMKENREFQQLIKELQDEAKEAALGVLKSGSVKAAKLLITAVSEGRVAKSRIDAANSILAKVGIVPELLYRDPNVPAQPETLKPEDVRSQIEERRRLREEAANG